jgi:hypothetical protein
MTVGKPPLERVHKLLSKLDSIRLCRQLLSSLNRQKSNCPINLWDNWKLSLKTFRNPWDVGLSTYMGYVCPSTFVPRSALEHSFRIWNASVIHAKSAEIFNNSVAVHNRGLKEILI